MLFFHFFLIFSFLVWVLGMGMGFFEYLGMGLGMGVGFFEYLGVGLGLGIKTHTQTQFTQNTHLI